MVEENSDSGQIPDDATRFGGSQPGTPSNSADPMDGIAVGTILNHTYQVEELINRGGMGEVYRAVHVDLQTEHAIKVIRPELYDDPKIVELFRREASALRNIRDDSVVAYEGAVRDESGRLYLVMEFVRGESLSDLIGVRNFSEEELKNLILRLSSGLAAAHRNGIVHRDMSPDNVILPNGDVENAKIIDFGIAKSTDPAAVTVIGDSFAGKYSYAAPEQLGLFGGEVDSRSDIYSLGLVIAASAIGRPLSKGASLSELMAMRQSKPDLSEVPDELRGLLEGMLEPEPGSRFQTMEELSTQMSSAHKPAPPLDMSVKPKDGKPDRKLNFKIITVTALTILIAAILATFLVFNPSEKQVDRNNERVVLKPAEEIRRAETSVPLMNNNNSLPSVVNKLKTEIKNNQKEMNIGNSDKDKNSEKKSEINRIINNKQKEINKEIPIIKKSDIKTNKKDIKISLKEIEDNINLKKCSFIKITNNENKILLSGFAGSDKIIKELGGGISKRFSNFDVKSDIIIPQQQYCAIHEALKTHTQLRANGEGGFSIKLNHSDFMYRGGDKFSVKVTPPSDAEFLYLVYVNSKGEVAQLSPAGFEPERLIPGRDLSLGDRGDMTISEPFGQDMLIALATDAPIRNPFNASFENIQVYDKVDTFLEKLSQFTNQSGSPIKSQSTYVYIKTAP